MAISTRSGGRIRTQSALAEINITPLVDVVLVLLLIFMLTAPVLQSGIEVAVPHTRTVSQLTEQRTVVTIDKNQTVYLALNSSTGRRINLADLASSLRADERVPFGAFANVMEAVKSAGITNISIVTQPITK